VTLESRVTAMVAHVLATDPDPATFPERQVARLVDEAGELLHEVLRVYGHTRSKGSLEEVAGEMADVVLAGQVTASVLGMARPPLAGLQVPADIATRLAQPITLAVFLVRQSACLAMTQLPAEAREHLQETWWAVRSLATMTGVDLHAAVLAKLAIVEDRLGVSAGGAA
jgi:NTP pyrophosphatase (non-canonical NTP hydrolase)